MARIKTPDEIERLRAGGKLLANILKALAEYVKPGISTEDINDYALKLAEDVGVEPVQMCIRDRYYYGVSEYRNDIVQVLRSV